jgi:small conductance mechanosensitive channel
MDSATVAAGQIDQVSALTEQAIGLMMIYGPKVVLAIITLFVGLWIIKLFERTVTAIMNKKSVDVSLQTFFASLLSITLKVLLVISVASMVGIEMTSFIALLGAAGLAVGMALSGTLQNFAGGVMILIFRPFKVGDYIEAQGYAGTVNEIQIFNTILKTPDNKTIIIPNAPLSTGAMINYSAEPTRRVDLTIGISYDDDIDQARAAIQELISADSRIKKDPEPMIAVAELADSSVNFTVRVWVDSADYWGVFFDLQESIKKDFDRRSITIPYPQSEVHYYQNGPGMDRAANA